MLHGADHWVVIETFGLAKKIWLRTFLALPGGIPGHDTFGRMFARLVPTASQRCLLSWAQAVAPASVGQAALDDKTLHSSHDRSNGKAALHLVSAGPASSGVVLG